MSSKLLTAACALSLLCGTSAFAQDHHGGGGGAPHAGGGGGAPHAGGGGAPHAGGGGGGFHGGGAPAAHISAAPAGGGFHGSAGGAHAAGGAAHGYSTTHVGGAHVGGAHVGGNRGGGNHGAHMAVAAGVAGVAVGAAIAHGGAAGGHHYSPQAFPHEVRPAHQYHYQGAWRQPQGYYYRHWGYGDRLPGGWFAQSFWLTNFWAYGLTAPPYDYAWVREGPDALLVNVYTGTVVEVEYGVFY